MYGKVRVVIPEADRKLLEAFQMPDVVDDDIRMRAKIILLAGEGYTNVDIAAMLHVSEPTASLWVNRYRRKDPEMKLRELLRGKHSKGKNRVFSNEARAWIRSYRAENSDVSLTLYTKMVHDNCTRAGFPELSRIARSSISAILKADL